MDPIKKRKIDDNGIVVADADSFSPLMLTLDDARKILEPFTHEVLLEIVQKAILRHPDVLDTVRSIADRDTTQRKLFIRGLGWETTTEKLRSIFSSYGELDEAVVILDKVTGKSKGYGFVTFKHIDGAMMALKEPSKKIDGRMTVTQLAAAGNPASGGPGMAGGVGGVISPADVSTRKIYVANVPYDMMAERLLQHFSMYGEIEEGPLGYDKVTGKSKGFALFVYKTADAAKASLVDPIKNIDGHQLNCKLAIDGKRGKPSGVGVPGHMGVQGVNQGNGNGIGATVPGGQYGGAGGVGGQYGGFSSGLSLGAVGPGSSAIGAQAAGSNLGGGGGFGPGHGGPFAGGSHFGGPVGAGYGGLESTGGGLGGTGAALGGPGSGYGGAGARLGGVGSGLGSAGGGTGGAAGGFVGAGGAMGGVGRGHPCMVCLLALVGRVLEIICRVHITACLPVDIKANRINQQEHLQDLELLLEESTRGCTLTIEVNDQLVDAVALMVLVISCGQCELWLDDFDLLCICHLVSSSLHLRF